jgi:hypothetical protein
MSGDQKFLEPIMSNSESIVQFGNNAYGKPATALNILRETIMGRELFDYALKCMRIVGNSSTQPRRLLEQWKMHLL